MQLFVTELSQFVNFTGAPKKAVNPQHLRGVKMCVHLYIKLCSGVTISLLILEEAKVNVPLVKLSDVMYSFSLKLTEKVNRREFHREENYFWKKRHKIVT